MSFNSDKHLEADNLRNQINITNTTIANLNQMKSNIGKKSTGKLRLVFVDNEDNQFNLIISEDKETSLSLITDLIDKAEIELAALNTEYENICD